MTEGMPRLNRSLKIAGVDLMTTVVMATLFFGGTPPKLFGVIAEFILFGIFVPLAVAGWVPQLPHKLPSRAIRSRGSVSMTSR
mgnify:CR=1 FL=1